jgi:hypothetical protein
VFSVLDLNSAYYQIPLTPQSRRKTALCTPFGLYEFNKLPMGISIGCQGLSRVVDNLFADLKGLFMWGSNFVFIISCFVSTHCRYIAQLVKSFLHAHHRL